MTKRSARSRATTAAKTPVLAVIDEDDPDGKVMEYAKGMTGELKTVDAGAALKAELAAEDMHRSVTGATTGVLASLKDPPEQTALVYGIWLTQGEGYTVACLRLPRSVIERYTLDEGGELLPDVTIWPAQPCSMATAHLIRDIEMKAIRGGL